MSKLSLAACAALLLTLPATAYAQSESHPEGADEAQHDHTAPPAVDQQPDAAPMARRQMEMGKHMEDCCCPCCRMMQQHGGTDRPDETEAPVSPDKHQH